MPPPGSDGWQEVAVDPDVVAARIAGISRGFCLADEVGSEWGYRDGKFYFSYFPNRRIYSSEHINKKPWMGVWIKGEDTIPPEPIQFVESSIDGVLPGQVIVKWKTPLDRGGENPRVQCVL